MNVILLVQFISILLSKCVCLLLLEVWYWNLELIGNSTCIAVIKSVQERSGYSEGLWNDTSDFTTVKTDFTGFNSHINDADTSKGGS